MTVLDVIGSLKPEAVVVPECPNAVCGEKDGILVYDFSLCVEALETDPVAGAGPAEFLVRKYDAFNSKNPLFRINPL